MTYGVTAIVASCFYGLFTQLKAVVMQLQLIRIAIIVFASYSPAAEGDAKRWDEFHGAISELSAASKATGTVAVRTESTQYPPKRKPYTLILNESSTPAAGGMYKEITWADKTLAIDRDSSDKLCCVNPDYRFMLKRLTSEWAVSRLVVQPQQVMPKEGNGLESVFSEVNELHPLRIPVMSSDEIDLAELRQLPRYRQLPAESVDELRFEYQHPNPVTDWHDLTQVTLRFSGDEIFPVSYREEFGDEAHYETSCIWNFDEEGRIDTATFKRLSFFKHKAEPETKEERTTQYSYEPANAKRYTLTHFGFPEPEGIRGPKYTWWLVAAAAFLILIVLIYRRRMA